MHDHATGLRFTLPEVLDAMAGAGYPTRQKGEQHVGGCPLCGEGDDRCWHTDEGGTLRSHCRICDADGPTIWKEIGLMGDAGSMVPPLMPSVEPRQEYRWWTPDQPEPVIQVRPGRHGKYDTPAGAKMKRCLFPGPVPAGSAPIIVSEGAKASMHAAGKSGLPAVALYSATTMPDDDVLRAAGIAGRELWFWPDVGGEGAMNRLAAHVAPLGCVVKHIHPDVIGLRTHGDDAEQWQPGPDPARRARGGAPGGRGRTRGGDHAPGGGMDRRREKTCRRRADTGGAWALVPRADRLAARAPWVAKTTYAAWVASCASREGLRVALLVDDDARSWAERLMEFDADLDRITVGTMADVARAGLVSTVEGADILILDSWRRWAATCGARGKGAMNDESQIGSVADEAVDVAHKGGAGVLLIANQGKDPDLGARGSVALEDAVDVVRTITRSGSTVTISTAGKVRHGIPEGPWRLTLGAGGFTHGGGSGGSGGGGELVPGTPEGRYEDATLKYLMQHGESSGKAIRAGALGRSAEIRKALDRLHDRGRVTRRQDARGGWLWTAISGSEPEVLPLTPDHPDQGVIPEGDPVNGIRGGSPGSGGDPEGDPGGGMGITRITGSGGDPEGAPGLLPMSTIAPLTAEPEESNGQTPTTILEDEMTDTDPLTDTGLQGFAALRNGKPACTLCRIAAIKPGDILCHHCRREKNAGKAIDPKHLTKLQFFDRLNLFEATYVEMLH